MQPVAISSTSDQLTELCRIVKWISSKEKFVFIQVLNSDSLQNTNVEIFLFLKCSIIQSLLITSFYCQEQHFVMEFKIGFYLNRCNAEKKISEIAKLIFVYFALFVCVCVSLLNGWFLLIIFYWLLKSQHILSRKRKNNIKHYFVFLNGNSSKVSLVLIFFSSSSSSICSYQCIPFHLNSFSFTSLILIL